MGNNNDSNDYQQYRPTYTPSQRQSNDFYSPANQPYQYNGYGFPVQSQGQMNQQAQQVVLVVPQTSGMAVASMVIGILGLLGLHVCGAFLIGIPLGHLALNKIKYSNGRIGGRGMAIAGLVMNYVPAIGIGLIMLFSLLLGGLSSTLTR